MATIEELEAAFAVRNEPTAESSPRAAAVPTNLDDRELIDRACNAANGAKFRALFEHGDTSAYGGDDSAADQALCNLIAFWSGGDAGQIDRVFRASALMRPEKWDRGARAGETYGEGTVRRAIEATPEPYRWAPVHLNGNEHKPKQIHSDALSIGVPSESILKWRTAAEIAAEGPAKPDWIAAPWWARGATTELDGRLKGGKTTLLFDMVACVLDGRAFLGVPTTKSAIVYLTEQQPDSFRAQLVSAGLHGRDDLHVLYWHDARGVEWPAVVDAAIAKCEAVGALGFIVDTLGPWARVRGDSENDAGAALEAVAPLLYAASHRLGVLVSRHERKGGGEVGESGRGSSAYSGAVDVVLALKRPEGQVKPSVRVIHALSRFSETPDTLVIERTADGYIAIGDQATVATSEARTALLAVAPSDEGSALTEKELFTLLPAAVKRTSARTALSQLHAEGEYRRLGLGVKGNPFRYWAVRRIHSDGTTISKRQDELNDPDRGQPTVHTVP